MTYLPSEVMPVSKAAAPAPYTPLAGRVPTDQSLEQLLTMFENLPRATVLDTYLACGRDAQDATEKLLLDTFAAPETQLPVELGLPALPNGHSVSTARPPSAGFGALLPAHNALLAIPAPPARACRSRAYWPDWGPQLGYRLDQRRPQTPIDFYPPYTVPHKSPVRSAGSGRDRSDSSARTAPRLPPFLGHVSNGHTDSVTKLLGLPAYKPVLPPSSLDGHRTPEESEPTPEQSMAYLQDMFSGLEPAIVADVAHGTKDIDAAICALMQIQACPSLCRSACTAVHPGH